jgi:hypothetical protein
MGIRTVQAKTPAPLAADPSILSRRAECEKKSRRLVAIRQGTDRHCRDRENMMTMRRLLLIALSAAILAGCQSGGGADVSASECDPRATDSGRCVPGTYPQ